MIVLRGHFALCNYCHETKDILGCSVLVAPISVFTIHVEGDVATIRLISDFRALRIRNPDSIKIMTLLARAATYVDSLIV